MPPDEIEEELDNHEIMEQYMDTKKFYSFEGERGVKQLSELFEDLGYKEESFLYGDPISLFLADNYGCIEAMLEWVTDNYTPEQLEGLRTQLGRK